jgi:hypothetical protein
MCHLRVFLEKRLPDVTASEAETGIDTGPAGGEREAQDSYGAQLPFMFLNIYLTYSTGGVSS